MRQIPLSGRAGLCSHPVIADSTEQTSSTGGDWISSTHWSVVLAAGDGDTPRAQAALEKLCRTYWKPLHRFARRQGRSEHDAEDLTQAFFAHLLDADRKCLRAADPARGKFRAFLLTAFRHFMEAEWVKARAAKRGGGKISALWEEFAAAGKGDAGPADSASPERDYDRQWATEVVAQAHRRLREEFAAAGKAEQFEHLKSFLSQPANQAAYAAAGERLGLSAAAVAVAVHRLRHRLGKLFRAEIAQTVAHPEDVEEERRYLMELLRG